MFACPTKALALLRELHGISNGRIYLFPTQRSNKRMSNNALLVTLECMGYKGR